MAEVSQSKARVDTDASVFPENMRDKKKAGDITGIGSKRFTADGDVTGIGSKRFTADGKDDAGS